MSSFVSFSFSFFFALCIESVIDTVDILCDSNQPNDTPYLYLIWPECRHCDCCLQSNFATLNVIDGKPTVSKTDRVKSAARVLLWLGPKGKVESELSKDVAICIFEGKLAM